MVIDVQIMPAFVRMRELLASNTALARKLDELERKYQHHDEAIKAILSAIRELMTPAAPKHRPIGRGDIGSSLRSAPRSQDP